MGISESVRLASLAVIIWAKVDTDSLGSVRSNKANLTNTARSLQPCTPYSDWRLPSSDSCIASAVCSLHHATARSVKAVFGRDCLARSRTIWIDEAAPEY